MIEIERAIEKKEYIERGALIAFVREVRKNLPKDSKDFFTRDEMLLNFQQYLELQKAADVEPVVHGEWIESEWRPKCSVCGHTGSIFDSPTSPFNFCPNCGAHMMDETKLRPAIIEQIPTARLRELAEAEREGRILILWKPFKENDGMFTVLYRRPDGVLMGRTDHTAEKAVKNATADYDAHYPRKEKPMKSEKLMPCPFCGSDDCEFTETKQQIDYKFRASYFAGCPDCGVYTDYCETKEEATERWNRRSADDHK